MRTGIEILRDPAALADRNESADPDPEVRQGWALRLGMLIAETQIYLAIVDGDVPGVRQ